MIIMIILWLIAKINFRMNMVIMIIIDDYGHQNLHSHNGHHDHPQDHSKCEEYDEYGYHDYYGLQDQNYNEDYDKIWSS